MQNLTAENETLRLEVHRLGDLCQKLSAENAILRVSCFFQGSQLGFVINLTVGSKLLLAIPTFKDHFRL